MESKLSIAEQLDLVEEALAELKKRYERGEDCLYMCWIFYDLLGLEKDWYQINTVGRHIVLFTLDNMVKHSKAACNEILPYEFDEYKKRRKFLKWMITEYKSMLAKN